MCIKDRAKSSGPYILERKEGVLVVETDDPNTLVSTLETIDHIVGNGMTVSVVVPSTMKHELVTFLRCTPGQLVMLNRIWIIL